MAIERWRVAAEIFVDDDYGKTVCTPIGLTPEIRKSRAKLIAAAPDLLSALQEARAGMSSVCSSDGCTCGDGWSHDDPQLIARLDDAIAKATGEREG